MDPKPEISNSEIASKFVELCKDSPFGIPDDDFKSYFDITDDRKLDILNKLINHKYIRPVQRADKSLVYMYQDPEQASQMEGLDRESKAIYDHIAETGTSGISKQDLNKRSGFNVTNVGNAIKNLEKRGLIKAVKSVKHKNKNIYILFNLMPNEDVTGGVWYSNNQFDKRRVDAFCEKALNYIKSQNNPKGISFNSICYYLRASELSGGDMSDQHVRDVLNVLIYNGEIEEFKTASTDNPDYKLSDWARMGNLSTFTLTPCGTCPVFDECKEGGIISPEKCVYFDDW